jgi:hypothetical protein
MAEKEQTPEAISVDDHLVKNLKQAIDSALVYEIATHGKRKLGITGEVGEVLSCHQLGLRLILDPRSEGFDATDKNDKRVQIKTRRSETEGLPRDVGRISRFSNHRFDYVLLCLLDHDYQLCEIWRADYKNLKPIIDKEQKERSGPTLRSFKKVGEKIFDKNESKDRQNLR